LLDGLHEGQTKQTGTGLSGTASDRAFESAASRRYHSHSSFDCLLAPLSRRWLLLLFLFLFLFPDLNRVLVKPSTAAVDSNGRPDSVVAAESWERHLQRNQSVIISNLQGQLKSRVVCPQCNKESITFDPFLTLQVPLPVVNTRELPVITVMQQSLARIAAADHDAMDAEAQLSMAPAVWPLKSSGTIGQLKAELCESILAAPSSVVGSHPSLSSSPIHPSTLLFVEVYQHKIFKVLIHMRHARHLFLSLFSSLSFFFFPRGQTPPAASEGVPLQGQVLRVPHVAPAV